MPRETGEREKESARRSRGDCYFSIFFLFMRYSAGAYAKEKVDGRLSRRLLADKKATKFTISLH